MGTDTQQQRREEGNAQTIYFETDGRGLKTVFWQPGRGGFLFEVSRAEVVLCEEVWSAEDYLRLLLRRFEAAVPVSGKVVAG